MALHEIETERLLLRQWRDGDWHGLLRTYGDAEVMAWIGTTAGDLASTAAAIGRMSMHWRLLGYGMFAVEERSTGELVGWGKGYATEGALASLELGVRELGLPEIFSMTRPDNTRSRAVMERCGLTQRGELEFRGWKQVHYAIDRQDWPPQGVPLAKSKIRRVG